MSFNPSVIPASGRSATAMAFHKELYKRSLDTFKIYNPTENDFICHFDRFGSNDKWIVPNKNKDAGHGKGYQHVPRYVMTRYLYQMGIVLINEKIKKDWDEKKKEYRLEDRSRMEENLAIRSNDPKLWDEITPILVKGIVTRYGGDDLMDEIEQEPKQSNNGTIADQALERLGLIDQDADIDQPEAKANLLDQIV